MKVLFLLLPLVVVGIGIYTFGLSSRDSNLMDQIPTILDPKSILDERPTTPEPFPISKTPDVSKDLETQADRVNKWIQEGHANYSAYYNYIQVLSSYLSTFKINF